MGTTFLSNLPATAKPWMACSALAWLALTSAAAQAQSGAGGSGGTVVHTQTNCPYQDPYDPAANNLCRNVTLTRSAQGTVLARVTLARGKPNTTYFFFVNCQQTGSNLITDAQGNGAATFDYFINWGTIPGGFAEMSSKISNTGNRCPR